MMQRRSESLQHPTPAAVTAVSQDVEVYRIWRALAGPTGGFTGSPGCTASQCVQYIFAPQYTDAYQLCFGQIYTIVTDYQLICEQ